MPPTKNKKRTEVIDNSDSPEPPASMCHLLRLPAELRNRIWEQLVHSLSYDLDPTLSPKAYPYVRYRIYGVEHGIKAQQQPAITRVCRQIRSEALSLYYSINTFMLGTDDQVKGRRAIEANRQKAVDWILSIGEDAKHLRRVRFPMRVWAFYVHEPRIIPYLITCNITADPDSFEVSASDKGLNESNKGHTGINEHCRHLRQMIVDFLQAHEGDRSALEKLWQALALLARNLIRVDGKLKVTGSAIEHTWSASESGCRSNKKGTKVKGTAQVKKRKRVE